MDDTTRVLTEVRETFRDKSRWTQSALARDRRGRLTDVRDPDAACHCLMGRLDLAVGLDDKALFDRAMARLIPAAIKILAEDFCHESTVLPVVLVNDYCGYESTMKMIDLAIAEAA